MFRFYQGRAIAIVAAVLARAGTAGAQAQPPPDAHPLLGSTLTADVLRDLPITNNPFAVLETILPEGIADRFSAGGLSAATAPRFGGFLNSWTQTQFRIGDVTISDPRAGGTPLVLPILPFFERMTMASGAMGVEDNAPALSTTLDPLRPGTTWFRAFDGALSAPPLASGGHGVALPAIDRVDQWQDGSVVVSGPVTDRLGLVAAGAWRGLSHVAAPGASATTDHVASGFAHLVFAATARDELRALGWAQQVDADTYTDTAVHVQSTWERHAAAQTAWRLFGGYTQRSRTAPTVSTLAVDSLTSDPVSDAIDAGVGSARRWVLGARVAPASRRLPTFGADFEGAQVRVVPTGLAQIDELVAGVPARVWTLRAAGGVDKRHLTTFAAYANEHLTAGRVTVDAGLRLDTVSAAADAAASGIQWTTWLPRALLRWQVAERPGLALVAGYRRSAYQLPLNVLAIGDPAAPVADVSSWNGTTVGPLVARVGPGTGGDPTLTQIDPRLRRPTTDELVLAVVTRPFKGLQVELARVTKREQPLLGLFDTGVDASAYTPLQMPDPSFIPGSPVGAAQVTVFNRNPGLYGRDRYLLTNQAGEPARFSGLQLTVRASTDRLTVIAGMSFAEAYGPAAAVGYLATENDQDSVGNLFVDPNSATYARGQLFQDRSHVAKIAGVYRFPWRLHLGAILRYEDGQPFSRLVIAPNLTQGATAVRSYASGGSAFMYIGTLDLRVQKVFTAGRSDVAVALDVYNLPNRRNEADEYVVTGTTFRTPTAVQPPRTALLGVRVTF